jgi:hypothetical protein
VPPLRSISARRILQTPMGARLTSLPLEGKGQFLYSMENFRKWFTRFHIPSLCGRKSDHNLNHFHLPRLLDEKKDWRTKARGKRGASKVRDDDVLLSNHVLAI